MVGKDVGGRSFLCKPQSGDAKEPLFFFLIWSKQDWKTIELVGEMEQPWCIQIYRMFAGQLEITENTTGQGADISL